MFFLTAVFKLEHCLRRLLLDKSWCYWIKVERPMSTDDLISLIFSIFARPLLIYLDKTTLAERRATICFRITI